MPEHLLENLTDIETFIDGREQQQRTLPYVEGELIPSELEFKEFGGLKWSIDTTVLGVVTDKFFRQFHRDLENNPDYAKSLQEHNPFESRHITLYPPNAHAILLYGIRDFSSLSLPDGHLLTPLWEANVDGKIHETIKEAVKYYAAHVYLPISNRDRFAFGNNRPSPTNLITGLDAMEGVIRQRLNRTGNSRFIAKTSLTALKRKTLLEPGAAGTELLPSSSTPAMNLWSIRKTVLEELTDACIAQLQSDVEANPALFTSSAIFSPVAKAILLHGINHERRMNTPDNSPLVDMVMETIIGNEVVAEAQAYASCITSDRTPGEIRQGFVAAEKTNRPQTGKGRQ